MYLTVKPVFGILDMFTFFVSTSLYNLCRSSLNFGGRLSEIFIEELTRFAIHIEKSFMMKPINFKKKLTLIEEIIPFLNSSL